MDNFGLFYYKFTRENSINPKFKNLRVKSIKTQKKLQWGHKLFVYYYSILDEFFCSRDLLALSQYKLRCDTLNITDLDINRDDLKIKHRGFRIYDEFLKESFLKSINIFDKIAVLLNHFESLGIKEKDVAFYGNNNIFDYKKNKFYNIIQRNLNDKSLIKLQRLQNKFDTKNSYPWKWRMYRNKITHNYFVIHENCDINKLKHPYINRKYLIDSENKFSHITYNNLLKHSIKCLKLAQNSIKITIDFINNKDQNIAKKYIKTNKVIEFKCGNKI